MMNYIVRDRQDVELGGISATDRFEALEKAEAMTDHEPGVWVEELSGARSNYYRELQEA